MNCPSCGAPMRLEAAGESLSCDYCGSLVFPEKNDDGVRVLGQPTGEPCPICAIGLVDASFAHARIRYCTRCHGMLIPILGFIFLPITTIAYAWMVTHGMPLEGVNVIILVVAVLLDAGSHGSAGYSRNRRA